MASDVEANKNAEDKSVEKSMEKRESNRTSSNKGERDPLTICCSKKCTVLVCVNCYSLFHKSCSERMGKKLQKVDEHKVICCEKENIFFDSREVHKLQIENRLLSKLITEIEDKNAVLKENNRLLQEKMEGKVDKINKLDKKHKQEQKKSGLSESKINNSHRDIEWPKHDVNKQVSSNMKELMDAQNECIHTIINLESDISREKTISLEIKPPSTSISNKQLGYSIQETTAADQSTAQSVKKITGIRSSPINNLSNTHTRHQASPYKYTNQITGSSQGRSGPRRRQKDLCIGTADIQDAENDFIGKEINKKVWLFISRVKDHVTGEKIKTYIMDKANLEDDRDVVVERIKTKYDDIRKDCQCFKVGIRFDLKEQVYTQNFWPKKVAFRRFDFQTKSNVEDEKDF